MNAHSAERPARRARIVGIDASHFVARLPAAVSYHVLSHLCVTDVTAFSATSVASRTFIIGYLTRAPELYHLTRDLSARPLPNPTPSRALGLPFENADRISIMFMCRHAQRLRRVGAHASPVMTPDCTAAWAYVVRRSSATLESVSYDRALATDSVVAAHATCARLVDFVAEPDAEEYDLGFLPRHSDIRSSFGHMLSVVSGHRRRYSNVATLHSHAMQVLDACRALQSVDLAYELENSKTRHAELRTALAPLALRHLRLATLPTSCVSVLANLGATLVSLHFCMIPGRRDFVRTCGKLAQCLPELSQLERMYVKSVFVDNDDEAAAGELDPTCTWRSASLTHLDARVPDDLATNLWPRLVMPALRTYRTRGGALVAAAALETAQHMTRLDVSQQDDETLTEITSAAWTSAIKGGSGRHLEILRLHGHFPSSELLRDMSRTWHSLRRLYLCVPRAALAGVPLLMRSLAFTLECCVIHEYFWDDGRARGPASPSLDTSVEPLRMPRLTQLELCADLWSAHMCRVLRCPRLTKLEVQPQAGARVSDLVVHLCDCADLTIYATPAADFSVAAYDRGVTLQPATSVTQLHVRGVTARMLIPLLSWFPCLYALHLSFADGTRDQWLAAVSQLPVALPDNVLEELVFFLTLSTDVPLSEEPHDCAAWRAAFVLLLACMPGLLDLDVRLPLASELLRDIGALVGARKLLALNGLLL